MIMSAEPLERLNSETEERISDGLVVVRRFSPRTYENPTGREVEAWLPEITVLQPRQGTPVTTRPGYIRAPSPVGIFELFFNPAWEGRHVPRLRDKVVFTFENGFVPHPQDPDQRPGDFVAYGCETTGEYDRWGGGKLSYTGTESRDHLVQCSRAQLESQLVGLSASFPNKPYDLHPVGVVGTKVKTLGTFRYRFQVQEDGSRAFATAAMRKLEGFLQ